MKQEEYGKAPVAEVRGESSAKVVLFNVAPSTVTFDTHRHGRLEIFRILSGELRININGKAFSAKADSIIITNPFQIHTGHSGEEALSYYSILFDLDNFYNDASVTQKYLPSILDGNMLLNNYIEDKRLTVIVDELIASSKANPMIAVGKIYEFFGYVLGNSYYHSSFKVFDNQNFSNVLDFLNKHFRESLSIPELSKRFGYSEAYLCRKFKKITGMTITNYITITRLEHAKVLLTTTDRTIGDIAYRCGFNDFTYFSHCFKKHFNVSPAAFRKDK